MKIYGSLILVGLGLVTFVFQACGSFQSLSSYQGLSSSTDTGISAISQPQQVGELRVEGSTASTIQVTYLAAKGDGTITYRGLTSAHQAAQWKPNSGTFGADGGTFSGLAADSLYDLQIVATNSLGYSTTSLLTGIRTSLDSEPIRLISSCGAITQSGSYKLSNDLLAQSASTSCLTLENVKDITLDCADHEIEGKGAIHSSQNFTSDKILVSGSRAIEVNGVKNITILNCKLKGAFAILSVTNSTQVTITKNEIGQLDASSSNENSIIVGFSDHVTFSKNRAAAQYDQVHTVDSVVSENTISSPRFGSATLNTASILFSGFGGGRNQFLNNLIDGKAQKIDSIEVGGADDGIILMDESESLIQGNSIKNVYDLAIETLGSVSGCTFRSNIADVASLGFIGGWYWSNFYNNAVVNNTLSNSPHLLYFYRYWGLVPGGSGMAPQAAVLFSGNSFSGNTLVPSALSDGSTDGPLFMPVFASDFWWKVHGATSKGNGLDGFGVWSYYWWSAPAETVPSDKDTDFSNNTFTNNDFGTSKVPLNFAQGNSWSVYRSNYIIDGGGNKCAIDLANKTNYPIHCN